MRGLSRGACVDAEVQATTTAAIQSDDRQPHRIITDNSVSDAPRRSMAKKPIHHQGDERGRRERNLAGEQDPPTPPPTTAAFPRNVWVRGRILDEGRRFGIRNARNLAKKYKIRARDSSSGSSSSAAAFWLWLLWLK